MTSSGIHGRIDFSTLSSVLGVIGRSPAWSTVQRDVQRLRTSLQSPTAPQDVELRRAVQNVEEFAGLLRRSSDTIGKALFYGAMVGKSWPADSRGERVLVGLGAIARAYRFLEKDDTTVASSLAGFGEAVRAAFPRLPSFPGPLPDVTDAEGVRRWRVAVERAIDLVDSSGDLGRKVAEDLAVRRSAWASAGDRVARHFSGGPQGVPNVQEIIVAGAGLPPANDLPFDLADLSIGHWSNLVWASLAEEQSPPSGEPYPSWVPAAALRALGWEVRSELVPWLESHLSRPTRIVRKELSGAGSPGDVFGAQSIASWPGGRGAPQSAVIVRASSATSLTNHWKPSPNVASIALAHEQIMTILKRLSPIKGVPPIEPAPRVVAFEMPLPRPDADLELMSTVRSLLGDAAAAPPHFYVYPEPPSASPSQPLKEPYVIAPRDLDALMQSAPTRAS